MQRDPTITALTDCGLACMRATNGHGRRWAVARCVRQLVAQGTPAGIAERSALAMVAVAAKVAAARLPEQDLPAGWKYGTRMEFAADECMPAPAAGAVKVKFSSRVEFPPSLPSGQPHPPAAEPETGPLPRS